MRYAATSSNSPQPLIVPMVTDPGEIQHPSKLAKVWDKVSVWVVMIAAAGFIISYGILYGQVQQNGTAQNEHHAETSSQNTTISSQAGTIIAQGHQIKTLIAGLNAAVEELDTVGTYLTQSNLAVCKATGATCPPIPNLPGISTTAFFPKA